MNVRAFGGWLMFLGVVLALVAGYYAYLPHSMRWELADGIGEAIKAGYSSKLADIRGQFSVYESRKYWFGIPAVASFLLGIALRASAKPVPQPSEMRKCPACAEQVRREATICRHCKTPLPPYVEEPAVQSKSYPLHEAIRAGNFSAFKELVNNGADLQEKNDRGQTPMDVACVSRDTRYALLIEKKLEEARASDS